MRWRSLCLVVALAAGLAALMASQARSQASAPQADAAASSLGLSVEHLHIRVMDVDRTKAFYRDKLGFPVTNETAGSVVEFPGLWFGKWRGTGAIPTGGVTIGLSTKSVDASYADLKKRGITIPDPPAQAHGAWSFTFKDPDGWDIEVEGPK